MIVEDVIVNKVAQSGLITLNLEEMYPQGQRISYDLKDNLFMGMILKEKDFREFLKTHDWSQYQDAYVAVHCSEDAIIPLWAYMLLAIHLEPYAKKVVYGSLEELELSIFKDLFETIDWSVYDQARVVVKGCSDLPIPTSVYVELTAYLKPRVKSLMFGEPCSTVPLYKQKLSARA
jgi:hypothetical protein